MENKEKEKASTVIETRNIYDLSQGTENIYESVAMLSKRANQIAAEEKRELRKQLDEVTSNFDGMEDTFENREQVEIVRRSERKPKATLMATTEYLNDELYFRNPAKENEEMQKLEAEEDRIVKSEE